MPVPIADLQQPSPSAIIELFEIELILEIHGSSDIYRFHNGTNALNNNQIVWAGNGYARVPIEADGFEYSGTGLLPRPNVRVSNLFGTITTILLTLPNGLEGAKLTRIRTLARYIDAVNFPNSVNPYGAADSTVEFPREVYFISQKTREDRDIVEFQCAAAFDLAGVRLPKRQAIANVCQWRYRGSDCGYTGTAYFDANDNPAATLGADICGKRLSSCELRFAAIQTTGGVTSGSNSLVVSNGAGVNTGDPISGFGIPSGTTVSSRSGNTITMSQNANGTSEITGRTGTLSSDGLTLNVVSATGIRAGMIVIDSSVPSGTRVSSVSGNALRLNIETNPWIQSSLDTATVQFAERTERFQRGVRVVDFDPRKLKITAGSLSGINAGDRVGGQYIWDGTTVTSTESPDIINLSKDGNVKLEEDAFGFPFISSFLASFWVPVSPSARTYSFSAPNQYVFRQGGVLPYGSFPGVGGAF